MFPKTHDETFSSAIKIKLGKQNTFLNFELVIIIYSCMDQRRILACLAWILTVVMTTMANIGCLVNKHLGML